MALLEVNVDGLDVLASRCGTVAGRLAAVDAPTSWGISAQATSAAVAAVHVGVGVTGGSLAERMQAKEVELAAARTAFAVQENRSAVELAAVAEAVER